MTADEQKDQTAKLCAQSLTLPGNDDKKWCAERHIKVSGKIVGIDRMDVQLDSFNGDVTAKTAPGNAWGFTATLTARGASEQEALQHLDDIQFTWSHEADGEHVVHVEAKHEGRSGEDLGADIDATLPSSIVYDLSAATANGDVGVQGATASLLNGATSNGNVKVTASFVHANLATSNGDVIATLTPLSTGDMNLATSNGKVEVHLPEGSRYGYDVEGTTSNGEVKIDLKDGQKGPCPEGSQYYTPPCDHRTFTTTSYGSRQIQSHGTFSTSNGDVAVGPS